MAGDDSEGLVYLWTGPEAAVAILDDGGVQGVGHFGALASKAPHVFVVALLSSTPKVVDLKLIIAVQ